MSDSEVGTSLLEQAKNVHLSVLRRVFDRLQELNRQYMENRTNRINTYYAKERLKIEKKSGGSPIMIHHLRDHLIHVSQVESVSTKYLELLKKKHREETVKEIATLPELPGSKNESMDVE